MRSRCEMKKNGTKRLTTLALLVAVAMMLSYIEAQIPLSISVPGVKLGLSNIATLFALYTLGASEAALVSLVRVILSSFIFANPIMMIYSLSGAALALLFMILMKRLGVFSMLGVSVVGGVMHNAGQIVAAVILMKDSGIAYYLVPLVISGTVAGIAIGVVAALLVKKIGKELR